MKRGGPLKRTELRRTAGLRPVSAKRRQRDAAHDDRPAFRAEFAGTLCWLCMLLVGCDIHHIFGRPNHPLCHHRTNLFWVCRRCHDDLVPVDSAARKIIWLLKRIRDLLWWDKTVAAELLKAKCGRIDL